jgi:glucans biosynthesis protein C
VGDHFALSIPLWAVWQLTPSAPQSLAGCFVLFLLGALFFASDALQDKLALWRWSLFIPFSMLSLVWISVDKNLLSAWWGTFLQTLIMWTGVLSCMGLGKRYLNFTNPATAYFSASSFALYIFHQSWLVGIAYYVTRTTEPPWAQAAVILSACLAATLATYELCRRIALTRCMFGVKR